MFCGISLGYADLSQPINGLVTERASFDEIAGCAALRKKRAGEGALAM